jgi:hypothetical protein
MKETSTALITADNEKIKFALTHPDALTTLLAEVKTRVDTFDGTTDTAKGRKEIASLAYKIAQTRVAIDKIGKNEIAVVKAEVEKYDGARKVAKDTLTGYQSDVRAPLDKWEDLRAKAKDSIVKMVDLAMSCALIGVRDIQASIKRLEEADVERYPEEMREEATSCVKDCLEKANEFLAQKQKANEDERELERLRKVEQDQKAKDEQARIIAEATETARLDALREIKAAESKAAQAEQDKLDAIADAKERAELAEAKRIDDIAQAEIALEQKVENERLQKLAEKQRQREERNARIRNTNHRASIQFEALQALHAATPIAVDLAVEVIRAITDGKINHVTINF